MLQSQLSGVRVFVIPAPEAIAYSLRIYRALIFFSVEGPVRAGKEY